MTIKQQKYRFLSAYIDPTTGRELLGSGGNRQCFHYYANARNVIRFGLRHPAFPAGQYAIYSWPAGTYGPDARKFLTHAYKTV